MTTPTPEVAPAKVTTKRPAIIWSIVLMAWPAVAIILSILLYAIVNMLMSANSTPSSNPDDLFGDEQSNPLRSIINVILFFVGGSAVVLGPISFIGGLILLIVTLNKK